MRALRYYGKGDIRLEEVEKPMDLQSDEVLVAVSMAGICGTDVSEYIHGPQLIPMTPHRASHQSVPLILGHEFMGVVSDVGNGVKSIKVGDRVVSGAGVWCGHCRACISGRTNLCSSYYTLGFQANGGMAEYVKVPEKTCVTIDSECSDHNAVLAQPLAVAVHAFTRTHHRDKSPLLVFGAGGIGSLYLLVAHDHGVPTIVADISEGALERAKRLGAVDTINLRQETLSEGLKRSTGQESIATAVECTGHSDSLRKLLPRITPGGTLMVMGLQSAPISLDFHDLVTSEITVRTSNAHICTSDLPEAVRLLERRDVTSLLVGRVVGMEDFVTNGLFPASRGETHGKVLVDIGSTRGIFGLSRGG